MARYMWLVGSKGARREKNSAWRVSFNSLPRACMDLSQNDQSVIYMYMYITFLVFMFVEGCTHLLAICFCKFYNACITTIRLVNLKGMQSCAINDSKGK